MWINHRYNDGSVIAVRPVFFNGKRWHVHRIPVQPGVECERKFVAVFASSGQRWPRSFGNERHAVSSKA